jgi:glycolate oxidase FAD binding subunit
MIVEPASAEEVADVLARANREGLRVQTRGAGTKSESGAEPRAEILLSTAKLNAVLAHRHGDLTATVQAGASLASVNRALAERGQWIPLDPPWADRATIGGLVATNDSGPRRHRYGAPRDLIIGIDFVRADGVAAKAGGIVVKNVAGYDIARLLTGSFGSLAVIVSATFKLYPLPPASRTVVVDVPHEQNVAASTERLHTVIAQLLASQLTPTAIEVQDPPLRLLVRFETIEVAAGQQAAAVVQLAESAHANAIVVQADEEASVWASHSRRPWYGDGAVIKITLLPGDIATTLTWLADVTRGVDYEVVGRAGVGALLARVGGGADAQARVLTDLRARIRPQAGSAVLVRGSDELKTQVDVWGPIGDGLAVMRAIKRQFDPNGILNPGRGPVSR